MPRLGLPRPRGPAPAPWLVLLAWLLAVAPARAAAPDPGPSGSVERVALLVTASDGGAGRATLRYTEADAMALASVLQALGGLDVRDQFMVHGASPHRLNVAFERVARRTAAAATRGHRVELVFYYSGHSDETGLLLGDERVSYHQLRAALESVPADVRIAFLDSCASGAFTRAKGGTRRAPFLVGGARPLEGHAYLTSSSENETAQESDRVGGSFFTHFLTTGLRGAADRDGDRRVTLDEAYRFAFDETLARTETSRGGAQHAAYDIELLGSGDLVMTDLRHATGRLEIDPRLRGPLSVRRRNGRLAAELHVSGDDPIRLALEPGRYTITSTRDGRVQRAAVEVPTRGHAVVEPGQLRTVSPEETTARGSLTAEDYVRVPFAIGIMPALTVGPRARPRITGFGAALLWSHSARVHGAALAIAADVTDEAVLGVQWTVGASISRGTVLGAQLAAGPTWARQSVYGAQLSTLVNATPQLHGVQLSTGVNWARRFRGAQLGLLNLGGGAMSGAQLGLVNVGGDLRGVQLGLFNYARSADASLGLLSITREGGVHPEVWTSDTAALNVGIRLPARYTYSFLAVGLHPFGRGSGWRFGGGLGGHVPIRGPAALDLDVGGYATFVDLELRAPLSWLLEARLLLAWRFAPRLTLWGGPSFGMHVDDPAAGNARLGYGWSARQVQRSTFRLRMWPGLAVGVRF